MNLSDEIEDALKATLQLLRQVALSCRQARAHLWHGGTVVNRQAGAPTY